jgi:iron(III) transport system permease protein
MQYENGPSSGAVRVSRWYGRWPSAGSAAVSLAILALTAAPIISLAVIAIGGDAELWPHLAAYVLPRALADTALLLLGVAITAGVAGAGTAWLVTGFDFPGRRMLLWLLPLPLAIPTYIAAYVYVDILEVSGPMQSALRALFGWTRPQDYWFPPVRSLGGAVFVFGMVLYPYVYLSVRAMLQIEPAAMSEAARLSGASAWARARDISLPLARPALAVGLALALLETLNDIGASEYLGVQTLTLSVFTTWLNRGSLAGAAQIALIMLGVVGALIALERYGQKRQGYAPTDAVAARRVTLRRRAGFAVLVLCLIPVTLGFLLPAGFLLRETIVRTLLTEPDPILLRHLLTTLGLASTATLLVLTLASTASILARLKPHPLIRTSLATATIGYAVPGTVLALGLLTPLVALDNAIDWLLNRAAGLMLIGSGAALVIAYAARFLAIGGGLLQASLARMPREFDHAARLAGAKPFALARDIHLPLLRPALMGAALLVFVDCLKELPATLLLRPLNTETLSTYLYQFATRGNFEEGSLAALLIVAAGLLPVIYLSRRADAVLAA